VGDRALPPAARIDRAEIIRRTEAQVRNLVGGEDGAAVDEEEIQLIVEARRRIWGGLNGGKLSMPHAILLPSVVVRSYAQRTEACRVLTMC